MVPVLSLAVFLAVFVLLVRALRQASVLRRLDGRSEVSLPRVPEVAVIVPARNEEAKVAACLAGVLDQDYPSDRQQVSLVDDQSEDATAAIARAIVGRDRRLVLRVPPLPPGWTGKGHACWVGARNLRGEPDWLCFLDADVEVREICCGARSPPPRRNGSTSCPSRRPRS